MKILTPETHTRARPSAVERAAFARYLAACGPVKDAIDIARQRWPKDTAARALLTTSRAAVSGATTTGEGWADTIVGENFGQFLTALQPTSAMARIIPRGLVSSMSGAAEAHYPARSTAPAVMPWVSETGAIPVTAYALDLVTVGPPRKAAIIVHFSRELARRSNGEAIFNTILREDAGKSLDAAYLSTDAGSSSAHAGLLNGVSALDETTGGGRDAMLADLAKLAAKVATGGSGQVVFIAAPERAAVVPILEPDFGGRVLASAAVPAGRMIALDPAALIHSFGGDPDISAGSDATIHAETSPAHIGAAGDPNVVAAPTRSMFQTAEIAVRCLVDIAFAKRTANAAAYIDDATW